MKRISRWAIFSGDVKAAEKYQVTHPPTKFFKTHANAKRYAKKHKLTYYNILSYDNVVSYKDL